MSDGSDGSVQMLSDRPLYAYYKEMFSITSSVVMIVEDGVIMTKSDGQIRFPGGHVKAGRETIQFAAIRHFKEQTGLLLQRNLLLPVDFRSDPERSQNGNEVDIGLLANIENATLEDLQLGENCCWVRADFEKRILIENSLDVYMDHDILLDRALDLFLTMKM